MKLPQRLRQYLDIAPEEIKRFILEDCEFIFGKIGYVDTVGYYAGEINGKRVIRFRSDNPRVQTFFHEIGHAYLNHESQKDMTLYAKQEKEADDFAEEILTGSCKIPSLVSKNKSGNLNICRRIFLGGWQKISTILGIEVQKK
jgi:hypothetical protein